MRTSKAGPWVIGTVLLAIAVLAAAWVYAVGPQREAAATAREAAAAARGQNVVQQQRLAVLQEQFAQIDTFRAELAALRTQVPQSAAMPALFRQINAAAAQTGVTVLATTQGVPEDFYPAGADPASLAAAAAETAAAEAAPAEGDAAVAAPADAPPVGVDGMVAIPVQVTVLGTVDATLLFLERLQHGTDRLFLVAGVVATGQPAAEAANGRPATQEGDAEMVIDGFVYVLKPEPVPAEGGEDATTAAGGEVQAAGASDG